MEKDIINTINLIKAIASTSVIIAITEKMSFNNKCYFIYNNKKHLAFRCLFNPKKKKKMK